MLGVLLLIIAVSLFIRKKRKESFLLFVVFLMDGFGIISKSITGIGMQTLAFIYMLVICLLSQMKKKVLPLDKYIKFFICFLFCSVLYSFFHYGLNAFQIFKGGFSHFLCISYFLFKMLRKDEIEWIFRILFYVTFVHSSLYIIQVLTGLPVLPYYTDVASIDESTGILRYYNYSPLNTLFLFLSIFYTSFLPTKYKRGFLVVFFLAEILTLGRTHISLTILCILLAILLQKKQSKKMVMIIILSIAMIPVANVISDRFMNSETSSDIEDILNGNYKTMITGGNFSGKTMTYRFALVYEKIDYLEARPFGEKVFGLGMLSETQPELVHRRYNFNLGLVDENGNKSQLYSPDISWANMICWFGYFGTFLFTLLLVLIMRTLYKYKSMHPLIFTGFFYVLHNLLGSFSGATLNSGFLCLPFLFYILTYKIKDQKYE